MQELPERDRLILSYQGVDKVPVKDFAIMIGRSYNIVRRRFKDCIHESDDGGYYIQRQLPDIEALKDQLLKEVIKS